MNIPSGCLQSDGMSVAEGVAETAGTPQTGESLRPELQRPRHQSRRLADQAPGVVHPFADEPARVARIDHLFDLEAVERPDRSARALDAGIDLGAQRGGIGGFGKLAFVGRLDAAFGRDAADIGRRPRHARRRRRARRRIVVAGDAEAAAHEHGEDRHRDLRERDHPFAALADGAGDLMLETHREARIVDQVQHREMEQVADVEMALQLVAAVGRQRAAVDVPAVGGDDAHRIAIQAHEAHDLVGAPQRPDLEERVLVGQQPDRPAHVEGRRALARHQGQQFLLAAVGGIGGFVTGGAS